MSTKFFVSSNVSTDLRAFCSTWSKFGSTEFPTSRLAGLWPTIGGAIAHTQRKKKEAVPNSILISHTYRLYTPASILHFSFEDLVLDSLGIIRLAGIVLGSRRVKI